jgi:hypothetical protein
MNKDLLKIKVKYGWDSKNWINPTMVLCLSHAFQEGVVPGIFPHSKW